MEKLNLTLCSKWCCGFYFWIYPKTSCKVFQQEKVKIGHAKINSVSLWPLVGISYFKSYIPFSVSNCRYLLKPAMNENSKDEDLTISLAATMKNSCLCKLCCEKQHFFQLEKTKGCPTPVVVESGLDAACVKLKFRVAILARMRVLRIFAKNGFLVYFMKHLWRVWCLGVKNSGRGLLM